MERRNNILGFIIYALVALILLLCGWWPAALILLLIYGLVLLMYKHNKKAQWLIDGDPSDKATLDGGKRIPFDSITGVSSKNSATPYTIGEYQIIINTNDKQMGTLRFNAGYDRHYATEAAAQVLHALK